MSTIIFDFAELYPTHIASNMVMCNNVPLVHEKPYNPVVLCVGFVAELVYEVFVQGRGGVVGTGPTEKLASISNIMCGQAHWWAGFHCTTQTTTT